MAVRFQKARYYAARYYKSRVRALDENVTGGRSRKKLRMRSAPQAVWTPAIAPGIDPLIKIKRRRRKEAEFLAITMF